MGKPMNLPPKEALPRHIGIILDGNGRWAKKRGLARSVGHKYGADAFQRTATACREIGIGHMTAYAFSTENWKRPPEEVAAIMDLMRDYLHRMDSYRGEDVCVHFVGDKSPLAPDIQELIAQAEEESAKKTGFYLNIALNYGGRDELVHAFRALAAKVRDGQLDPAQIDEEAVSAALYTAGQPDPDLIIRPSGEKRLSNFLTWQSAYSELIFMDVLWPDFSEDHLCEALWEYARRDRRFGGV